jgi:hypothetical protein
MKFNSLSLLIISALSSFISSIKAQDIGVNAVNLVGWEGCSSDLKKKIGNAWEDAVAIGKSFQDTKIDWNGTAAVEYLGPPGFNEGVQAQIQAVFESVASFGQGSWFWHPSPLKIRINVRCDDWKHHCGKQPAVAYTDNFIGGTTGSRPVGNDARANVDTTVINFCPPFDLLPSLSGIIAENEKFTKETQLNMDNYRGNTGEFQLRHVHEPRESANEYSVCGIPRDDALGPDFLEIEQQDAYIRLAFPA